MKKFFVCSLFASFCMLGTIQESIGDTFGSSNDVEERLYSSKEEIKEGVKFDIDAPHTRQAIALSYLMAAEWEREKSDIEAHDIHEALEFIYEPSGKNIGDACIFDNDRLFLKSDREYFNGINFLYFETCSSLLERYTLRNTLTEKALREGYTLRNTLTEKALREALLKYSLKRLDRFDDSFKLGDKTSEDMLYFGYINTVLDQLLNKKVYVGEDDIEQLTSNINRVTNSSITSPSVVSNDRQDRMKRQSILVLDTFNAIRKHVDDISDRRTNDLRTMENDKSLLISMVYSSSASLLYSKAAKASFNLNDPVWAFDIMKGVHEDLNLVQTKALFPLPVVSAEDMMVYVDSSLLLAKLKLAKNEYDSETYSYYASLWVRLNWLKDNAPIMKYDSPSKKGFDRLIAQMDELHGMLCSSPKGCPVMFHLVKEWLLFHYGLSSKPLAALASGTTMGLLFVHFKSS